MTKLDSWISFLTNDVDLTLDGPQKWGLGFMINTTKTREGRGVGSLGWRGLANTYFWIDSEQNMVGVILMQVLPFADRICQDLARTFEAETYRP